MYQFEEKSVDNKCWFDLGFNWVETNFDTIEPELYCIILQPYVSGNSDSESPIFYISIVSAKKVTPTEFHFHSPTVKDQQSERKICCFGSLVSEIFRQINARQKNKSHYV